MKQPTVFSDNPDIVPAKVWYKKGFLGGGSWYVKWTIRGEIGAGTVEMEVHGGSRGGNGSFRGKNFNYTVDWN